MFYWYFKLFNNIKSSHEANELAKLELESLFGNVEPIYNFVDKLIEEPFRRFLDSSDRLQDFVTYELPYGRIQGYCGITKNFNLQLLYRLVRRLAYTREIYIITKQKENGQSLLKEISFNKGVLRKNFHYFENRDYFCFRFITNQYFFEKSEYISKLSRDENEIERNVNILFSHLIEGIYRIPSSSTLSIGKRLQDYFAIREEPSLYLSHYFHPYKGKFHPKMVRALLNYIYPYDEGLILDNFAGSGTLLVEATLMGLNSIGIEINPLSVLMSNVKCKSLTFNYEELKREIFFYFRNVENAIFFYNNLNKNQINFSVDPKIDFNVILQKSEILLYKVKNYIQKKDEIVPHVLICKELLNIIRDRNIREFLLLSLSGTISDVARRTKEQFLNVFKERVSDLCLRIFLFKKLNEILKIELGESITYLGDSRDMRQIISSEQIDGIVTSPPYSVAIDYIKNDFPQLVLLELTDSIEKLETKMIGNPKVNYNQKCLFEDIKSDIEPSTTSKTANKIVKYLLSNGRKQAGLRSLKFYFDMDKSLREMFRVMKKNSKCAIIIGNNHFLVGNQYIEIPNDQVFLELGERIGFTLDKFIGRELQKSSEGNIREEKILIFKKE